MPHSAVLLKMKCIHRATHHMMRTKDFIFYLYSFYCYERIFCVLWIYARSIKTTLAGKSFPYCQIHVYHDHSGTRTHWGQTHVFTITDRSQSSLIYPSSISLSHCCNTHFFEVHGNVIIYSKNPYILLWGWRNMNTIWFVATWVEQRGLPPICLTHPWKAYSEDKCNAFSNLS